MVSKSLIFQSYLSQPKDDLIQGQFNGNHRLQINKKHILMNEWPIKSQLNTDQ